jgi:hypothetical protein
MENNNLIIQAKIVLEQLSTVINQLITNDEAYSTKQELLEASIGEHTRHIIELFQCLLAQYDSGIINYDARVRNKTIQTEALSAVAAIQNILEQIHLPNKPLQLHHINGTNGAIAIDSNYNRELLYNIEHTIHHLALIKIGLAALPSIQVPQHFGVAPSTIQYKLQCAQ